MAYTYSALNTAGTRTGPDPSEAILRQHLQELAARKRGGGQAGPGFAMDAGITPLVGAVTQSQYLEGRDLERQADTADAEARARVETDARTRMANVQRDLQEDPSVRAQRTKADYARFRNDAAMETYARGDDRDVAEAAPNIIGEMARVGGQAAIGAQTAQDKARTASADADIVKSRGDAMMYGVRNDAIDGSFGDQIPLLTEDQKKQVVGGAFGLGQGMDPQKAADAQILQRIKESVAAHLVGQGKYQDAMNFVGGKAPTGAQSGEGAQSPVAAVEQSVQVSPEMQAKQAQTLEQMRQLPRYQTGVASLKAALESVADNRGASSDVDAAVSALTSQLTQAGVPEDMARAQVIKDVQAARQRVGGFSRFARNVSPWLPGFGAISAITGRETPSERLDRAMKPYAGP